MSKKWNVLISLIVLLSVVLAACAPAATATVAPTEAVQPTTAPAAEQPTAEPAGATEAAPAETAVSAPAVSDAVLVTLPSGQSNTTFTRNFNPFGTKFLAPTRYGIYEPLMVYNRIKSELVPWLATEYAWSEDYLTLTFTLRDGVKWSDGEPFTAKDVVYTFNLLKSNNALSGTGQGAVKEGGYVSEVKAVSDTDVEFVFSKVYVPGLYEIINQVIVPEHIWTNIADPSADTNDNPVGTGPFTEVVEFKDQVYQVDRNPNYWMEGKPAFKGVRYPAFSGNDTAANMLIAGDADWTGQYFTDIPAISNKNPDAKCWWPAVSTVVIFMTNTTKAPFDDVVMRKAISMSFDRAKLINIALQGNSSPGDITSLNEAFGAYKADLASLGEDWTAFDPDKANAMLDEAGYTKGADGFRTYKDGSPMELEFINVNGFTDWLAVAPLMKQELNNIGLNIVMNSYDSAVAFDKWFKGEYDMSLSFADLGTPTLYSHFLNAMSPDTVKPVGEASSFGVNLWRYGDPQAKEWIDKLASTMDEAVVKEAATELQKLFAANAPYTPMWNQPTFYCWSEANFTGWPSAENPYAVSTPTGPSGVPESLLYFTTITAK